MGGRGAKRGERDTLDSFLLSLFLSSPLLVFRQTNFDDVLSAFVMRGNFSNFFPKVYIYSGC